MATKQYIYVVWSPEAGLLVMAYRSDQKAHDHARTMLGVKVTECEIRDSLPPELADDVYVTELEDFDDEETPIDELPPLPPTPDRKLKLEDD